MNRFFITALLGIVLAGCVSAYNVAPTATGGSKADGTVEMSFEHTENEKPVLDWNNSTALAVQRCEVWGYTGATPFGGERRSCQQTGGWSGCALWLVTLTYQCTN